MTDDKPTYTHEFRFKRLDGTYDDSSPDDPSTIVHYVTDEEMQEMAAASLLLYGMRVDEVARPVALRRTRRRMGGAR